VRDNSARVAEAQLRVREAKANLDREQALLDTGATTKRAVDDKRGVYAQSLSYLKTVQALSYRRSPAGRGKIMAPITGVVTKVNVNVGDILPPNADAVTIIDPSSFKVYAEIDELDINSVRPGQEAVVSFESAPGERYRARVERIVPQADEERKTLPVVLYIGDYIPNLSDGLSATVNIVQERRPNALTIPSAAIIDQSNGQARLFVVGRNNTLELRKVRIGIRGEEYVEILEGVQEDDRVVLDPQEGWEDGMSVDIARPKKQTPAAAGKGA
jgi:RND family efflux transporter MFP subunit